MAGHEGFESERDRQHRLDQWEELVRAGDRIRGDLRAWIEQADVLHDSGSANNSPAHKAEINEQRLVMLVGLRADVQTLENQTGP